MSDGSRRNKITDGDDGFIKTVWSFFKGKQFNRNSEQCHPMSQWPVIQLLRKTENERGWTDVL